MVKTKKPKPGEIIEAAWGCDVVDDLIALESAAPPIQAGSGSTNTSGDAAVTFPTPFPSPPKVFLQGVDSSARGIVLDVVSVSTTGFTVKARRVTGMTTSATGSHSHSITKTPAATGETVLTVGQLPAHHHEGVEPGPAATEDEGENQPHSHTYNEPSANTGTTGSHSHSVDATILAVSFYWLAVRA